MCGSPVSRLAVGCVVLLMPMASAFGEAIAPSPQPAPATIRKAAAVQTPEMAMPLSVGSEPALSPTTYERTQHALALYEELAQRGGWTRLSADMHALAPGSQGPLVAALRDRLAVEGDLDLTTAGQSDVFDAATAAALKRFQARHGLSETGTVGRLTLRALNKPVETKVKLLRASLERLNTNSFSFGIRYVVVNIPGASVEAVENGAVVRRYNAVVGRKDRPSPELTTKITAINLNPTWTVPLSIVKSDILPKMREDPGFLAKSNMHLIDANGAEIDPATIDWTGKVSIAFTVRQDPGVTNSLGQLRIDMPNPHAVYMHDTPKKELFRSDVRFHSSGCARVADVRDLAAWLMQGSDIDRNMIDMGIASGERQTFRLPRSVPIAWIYLTAWGTTTQGVQFRDDIYGLDIPAETPAPKPDVPREGPDAGDITSSIGAMPLPPARPAAPSRSAGTPIPKADVTALETR